MPVAPLIYFSFNDPSYGRMNDVMGDLVATYYFKDGKQAIKPATAPTTSGAPLSGGGTAVSFNGTNSFAYIAHSEELEIQNGTIGLWVKPDSIIGEQTFVSKDESGSDAGGHFKIAMDDGRLVVRFAPGDGGSNMGWASTDVVLTQGAWTHLAMSFGADGVHLYVNGVKLDDADLIQVEGWKMMPPSQFFEAHLLTNDKPIILGADAKWINNTTSATNVVQSTLTNYFDGSIDGFGIWGGADPSDALSAADILSLATVGAPPLVASPPVPEPVVNDNIAGTSGDDYYDGRLGNDLIDGKDGNDVLLGGYGNDKLIGGDENDTLDGGRGNDLLIGGAGNDVLISSSDAGEPDVGQTYNRNEGRNGELDPVSGKLYPNQAFYADDVLIGGAGADDFIFRPLINAKRDIILKHQDDDRRIDWSDVAGENGNVHDHWVDSIGTDRIADYDKAEGDQIYIYGHTATPQIFYRDVDSDGDMESIIRLYSRQANGGAHDKDFLGQIIVYGDKVVLDDLKIKTNVTYGIVDTVEDLDEALNPTGQTDPNVKGYGSLNPYLSEVDYRDPNEDVGPGFSEYLRPRSTVDASDDTVNGTAGNDILEGDPEATPPPASLASPLSFWRFDAETNGLFSDERGLSSAGFYDVYDDRAFLQTDGVPLVAGPTGGQAAVFDGRDNFAYIANDPAYQVMNGTVTAWFKTDEIGKLQTIFAKDERNSDEGGHFYVMIDELGHLKVRLAEGNGKGDNHTWRTLGPVVQEDAWHHVAVSFTADGAGIYLDGNLIPDLSFERVEGNGDFFPSQYNHAYSLGNDKPLIIGANSFAADDTNSAEILAQNDDLHYHFDGAIADVGIWGGKSPSDALTSAQIADLVTNGPGALNGPVAAPTAVPEGDDLLRGYAGNDILKAGAGDDTLEGGDGLDQLFGGYGRDILRGGNDADVLEGGHGQDRLEGGAGNDILISMADDREPEIAQAYGKADDPDYEIDPATDMLYPSQSSMPSSDRMVGGDGADVFRFVTLINAKQEIINKHVNDDRTINWRGVAGENNNVHDHWVDGIGRDVISDFNRAEGDFISITGHTTEVYRKTMTDADRDGQVDDSVLHLRSNQGANGGAHNLDLLGTITILNANITEEDYSVKANVHFGIVDTIDEIDEAITPLKGIVTVNYSGAQEAVIVNLDDPTLNSGMQDDYIHPDVTNVIGSNHNDFITGDDEANVLNGGKGADILDGGDGSDILSGNTGNDTYIVQDSSDTIIETSKGGTRDRIASTSDYVMSSGAYVELLTTTSSASTADINLTGNTRSQTIIGNAGDNYLNGGGSGGADTLRGLGGNDKYRIHNSADKIFEYAGDGNDRTLTSVNYQLASGVHVETLTTSSAGGTKAISLIGNTLAQTIFGNAGNNYISSGGAGAGDSLRGLGGNDTYRVYNATDAVVEGTGGGADRVKTSVSYALGAGVSVESLTTHGSGGKSNINLTGNELAQSIIGNAGRNVISDGGGSGVDSLRGLKGNDTYIIRNANTAVIEVAGEGTSDRIAAGVDFNLQNGVSIELLTTTSAGSTAGLNLTGNTGSQTIIGDAGDNYINGGGSGGRDVLRGLDGDDKYRVHNSSDKIFEYAGDGNDRVITSVDYQLASGVEVETMTTNTSAGTKDIDLTGNEFAQAVLGNAGDNRLDGKAGADSLRGMAGADTFVFSSVLGNSNVDTIVDFNVAADQIELEDAIFSAIAKTGQLLSGYFKANAAGVATDSNDRIIYDNDSGELYYDADGNGSGAAQQFATLSSGLALRFDDFDVV